MTPERTPEEWSYPIGRFKAQPSYTADERAANLARFDAFPAALAEVVKGLSAADWASPYRPGGWTVREVVHHVADSHINMIIRLKFALTMNEPTIMPYDEAAWAKLPDVAAVDPLVSVAMIAAIHARAGAVYHALSADDYKRKLFHPENGPMTIEQVLANYAWHGDHHLTHIKRRPTA